MKFIEANSCAFLTLNILSIVTVPRLIQNTMLVQISLILGGSRRGSYYGDDITSKATVAMVVDDPESKDKINALLGDEGKKIHSPLKSIEYFL